MGYLISNLQKGLLKYFTEVRAGSNHIWFGKYDEAKDRRNLSKAAQINDMLSIMVPHTRDQVISLATQV